MNFLEVPQKSSFDLSFEQARSQKNEGMWSFLKNISVEHLLQEWLNTLSPLTRRNYYSGMSRLASKGLIDSLQNMQTFALLNHDAVVDKIKLVEEWSEATRQARAACYISFTGFLSRRSQGLIKKAHPCREGTAKTFFRVHDKIVTKAMTRAQWTAFFEELDKINPRDSLIGKVMIQGGKRAFEVLSLTKDRIDFDNRQIAFKQTKTKGRDRETVITYSDQIMGHLKKYIGDRNGLVFITRKGNPVRLKQIDRTFAKAGSRAGIPFKITPHVLRASTVTYLKSQGFSDTDIMGVTGHASAAMIHAYDRRELGQNASKKVNLI